MSFIPFRTRGRGWLTLPVYRSVYTVDGLFHHLYSKVSVCLSQAVLLYIFNYQ